MGDASCVTSCLAPYRKGLTVLGEHADTEHTDTGRDPFDQSLPGDDGTWSA